MDYLKNNGILTRNQCETLKYINDIKMPIYNNTVNKNNNMISSISNEEDRNSFLTNILNKELNGYDNKIPNISNSYNINKIQKQYLTTDLCVACRKRQRTVVLWPCGCFCLCDTCRKILALQKYNNCPCTNNEVEGYSKVFIP